MLTPKKLILYLLQESVLVWPVEEYRTRRTFGLALAVVIVFCSCSSRPEQSRHMQSNPNKPNYYAKCIQEYSKKSVPIGLALCGVVKADGEIPPDDHDVLLFLDETAQKWMSIGYSQFAIEQGVNTCAIIPYGQIRAVEMAQDGSVKWEKTYERVFEVFFCHELADLELLKTIPRKSNETE